MHISAFVQAPCSRCLVTHQNGRKMSNSDSIGVTSKVFQEKCLLCWRIISFVKYSPAPCTIRPSTFSRVRFEVYFSTGIRNHFMAPVLIKGTEYPVSRRTHNSCWQFSQWIFMRMSGLAPLQGFFAGLPPSASGVFRPSHFAPYIMQVVRKYDACEPFKNPPHCLLMVLGDPHPFLRLQPPSVVWQHVVPPGPAPTVTCWIQPQQWLPTRGPKVGPFHSLC